MLPFLGFIALCVALWWVIYECKPDALATFVKVGTVLCFIAGAIGILCEIVRRGGRMPF